MEVGTLDGRKDGELNSVNLVDINEIVVAQDDFFHGEMPSSRCGSGKVCGVDIVFGLMPRCQFYQNAQSCYAKQLCIMSIS